MRATEFVGDLLRKILALPRKDEEWYYFFNHSFCIPKEELLKHGWDKKYGSVEIVVTDNEIILKK